MKDMKKKKTECYEPTAEEKAGILRHIRYEIEKCLLVEEGINKHAEWWVIHMVHARVLIDFFEGKITGHDDVLCMHLGFQVHPLQISDWYRHKLNKDLVHLTYARVKRTSVTQGWNISEVIQPIHERAKEFVHHIIQNPPHLSDEAELNLWMQLQRKLN